MTRLILFLATLSIGIALIACQNATTNPAANQLPDFLQSKPIPERMTTSWGAPVSTKTAVLTAGPRGPMLLQDVVYLDEMAHFDRERFPERVVHAKGSGAHGIFEVTHDVTRYTKAKIFSTIGKRTPCFFRFSTVAGEMGSADTARDPRGFAMKYYTEEGNWDLVGNNAPIFFIRDPILFPSFIHSQKRNPVTNLHDPNMVWDFWSQRPEALHMIMRIFSDLGTPDGYRKMDGFGSHTFKLVSANGTAVFCKFHLKTQQGVQNLTAARARQLTADDPDYAQRDLYNSIANGQFPKWDMKIQVMTFQQAATHRWNPFDVTKTWPEDEFPLISIGTVTLNRNPANYFEEVEQAAFAPARMVPGIEPSPDKMLQGRLFAYPDTQLHRLGVNFMKLPINCPFRVNNTQINGFMRFDGNEGGAPVYHPNTFNGPRITGPVDSAWSILDTSVARYESGGEANYDQPAIMWNQQLDQGARERLVANIAGNLGGALPRIQCKMLEEFTKVNATFGQMLRQALNSSCGGGNACPNTTPTVDCAQGASLITPDAANQTALTNAIFNTVFNTTTSNGTTWTMARRKNFDSYWNTIRAIVWENGTNVTAKISRIVTLLAGYSTNDCAFQAQFFRTGLNMSNNGCSWGRIGHFVRCGTQQPNGTLAAAATKCPINV